MRSGLVRLKHVFSAYDWQAWMYHGRMTWLQLMWFMLMLGILAWLDGSAHFVWLVPPFAATLTILLLLPRSPIAQPIAVVFGSTLGASVGTAVSLLVHGPFYAVLVAGLMVFWLPRLRIYHPPGVALSMYPLLLHTGIGFPLVVVLPFTLVSVVTCSLLSRVSMDWPEYPMPLRRSSPEEG